MTERLRHLAEALSDGTWRPGPLRQVRITAYTGKEFTAVIPTVSDRVVQRALRDAMLPVLEAHAFRDFVSGWARPRRNRLTAVRQAAAHLEQGYAWAADVDVHRVSSGATATELVDVVSRWVHDGSFLRLLHRVLSGLPEPIVPGTVLAPTLLNLRLSPVDDALAELPVVRFADNYVVFAVNHANTREAFALVSAAMADRRLTPAPGKSGVRRPNPEDLFLIAG